VEVFADYFHKNKVRGQLIERKNWMIARAKAYISEVMGNQSE
jgi:hypothetical protein